MLVSIVFGTVKVAIIVVLITAMRLAWEEQSYFNFICFLLMPVFIVLDDYRKWKIIHKLLGMNGKPNSVEKEVQDA